MLKLKSATNHYKFIIKYNYLTGNKEVSTYVVKCNFILRQNKFKIPNAFRVQSNSINHCGSYNLLEIGVNSNRGYANVS